MKKSLLKLSLLALALLGTQAQAAKDEPAKEKQAEKDKQAQAEKEKQEKAAKEKADAHPAPAPKPQEVKSTAPASQLLQALPTQGGQGGSVNPHAQGPDSPQGNLPPPPSSALPPQGGQGGSVNPHAQGQDSPQGNLNSPSLPAPKPSPALPTQGGNDDPHAKGANNPPQQEPTLQPQQVQQSELDRKAAEDRAAQKAKEEAQRKKDLEAQLEAQKAKEAQQLADQKAQQLADQKAKEAQQLADQKAKEAAQKAKELSDQRRTFLSKLQNGLASAREGAKDELFQDLLHQGGTITSNLCNDQEFDLEVVQEAVKQGVSLDAIYKATCSGKPGESSAILFVQDNTQAKAYLQDVERQRARTGKASGTGLPVRSPLPLAAPSKEKPVSFFTKWLIRGGVTSAAALVLYAVADYFVTKGHNNKQKDKTKVKQPLVVRLWNNWVGKRK